MGSRRFVIEWFTQWQVLAYIAFVAAAIIVEVAAVILVLE